MSDEYDEEYTDSGAVPAASGPLNASANGLRTFDRRIVGVIGAVILIVAAAFLFTIHSVRESMAGAAETHAVVALAADAGTSLHLPAAATPTPLTATPAPVMTLRPTSRPEAPLVAEEVPQTATGAATAAAPQTQPRTPSPEEAFAVEERRRVLEARRASTRIEIDSDRALAQQSASDERNLTQASRMPGAASADASTSESARGTHQQFLAQQRGAVGYLPTQSRFELRRGTIINARWLTTLDSTLPGGVLKAMVTNSVKDSLTHSAVVLPAGTILTGVGDSQTQAGEARYLCAFDEIELPAPDSRTFYMGPNPGSGRQGESGVDVAVDIHAGRDFGHAALYSVLQAGVNLASRASTVVDIGGGSGQVFQQNQRSTPTFHAYVGQPLTIIVAQDIPLDRFLEANQ